MDDKSYIYIYINIKRKYTIFKNDGKKVQILKQKLIQFTVIKL